MPLGNPTPLCESRCNPAQEAALCPCQATNVTRICFQQQRSQALDEHIRRTQKSLWTVKSTQSIPPLIFFPFPVLGTVGTFECGQKCGPVGWSVQWGGGWGWGGFKLYIVEERSHAGEVPSKMFRNNVALELFGDRQAATTRQLMWFSRVVAGVHTFTNRGPDPQDSRQAESFHLYLPAERDYMTFQDARWGDDPI